MTVGELEIICDLARAKKGKIKKQKSKQVTPVLVIASDRRILHRATTVI